MKLLFASNYYPPAGRGGYEQWCQEVATALAARGHEVHVLTSRSQYRDVVDDASRLRVHRVLHLEVEKGLVHTALRLIRDRRHLEAADLSDVRHLIVSGSFDAVLIWGMWNVPRTVPAMLETLMAGRVAYYLCDYWPSLPSAYTQQLYSASRRRLGRLPKRLLAAAVGYHLRQECVTALRLDHPICVSHAVRSLLLEYGIKVDHAKVIYGGTRIAEVKPADADPSRNIKTGRSLRLLYAGRLEAIKGVHTAINALALLAESGGETVTLDVVGSGDEDYAGSLKELVLQRGLTEQVSFRASVSRSEIPAILAEHDALVFPSEWNEPFPRIVLEAMAYGVVVIGTTTGGTGEILVGDRTGLTFPVGDADALARQITRLAEDSLLRGRLVSVARQIVVAHFALDRMVSDLENALLGLCGMTGR